MCAKLAACDRSYDAQICEIDCGNELAVMGPRFRPEYIARIESCYVAQDCATVLSGEAEGECSDEAAAALAPSQIGFQFCDAFSNASMKCSSSLDMGSCLEMAKLLNDGALIAAQGCLNKSCSDMDACVAVNFGF